MNDNIDNYEDLEENILPKEITGPFKLDPDFMQELERSRPPKPVKLKFKSYSLDFPHEEITEIRVPTIKEAAAQIKSGKTSHNINFTEAVATVSYGGNKQSPKKQEEIEDTRNEMNETTKESVTDIEVINDEGPVYWKERLKMWNNVLDNLLEGKEKMGLVRCAVPDCLLPPSRRRTFPDIKTDVLFQICINNK